MLGLGFSLQVISSETKTPTHTSNIFTAHIFSREFSDIFDLEHFKRVLTDDVRIVSALPSTHLMTKPVESSPLPHATPQWIRGHYLRRGKLCSINYSKDFVNL
ncbi:o-fucosyltransferase 20 [Quercus suber]|uniref:O-fucosyltransferase 20 n=1 Tax=Quercus suber TaxID=58331 RepID=A0AAW0MF74_QUESU